MEPAETSHEPPDVRRRRYQSWLRVQARERSRSELIAWISHDLRAPLATIRAHAAALEAEMAGDAATIRRSHTRIREQAERLLSVVDDLLELTRTGADGTVLRVVDGCAGVRESDPAREFDVAFGGEAAGGGHSDGRLPTSG